MRTLLNASLRYGNKEIIVGVATVASRKELKLKTLHICGTPITLKKWCPSCAGEVEDTVKGWEQIPGSYLALDEKDLAGLAPLADKMVEIKTFMRATPSSWHVERSYWLTPAAVDLGYWDLYSALLAEKASAVGTAVLWGKESPCAVEAVKGKGLLISLLYYDQEIASIDLVPRKLASVELAETRAIVRRGLESLSGKTVKEVFSPPERVSAFLASKMAANAKGKETVLKSVRKALAETKPKRVTS